ncbi:MAG: hypothetical protein JXA71_02705 [Chitinispirillaceae bacterium]|nr:hypothetical protein [Chitinispirillaceae bacterium]
MTPRTTRPLWYAVMTLAVVLRIMLCFVNREANDNHVEVVERIIAARSLPDWSACDQCYQPKLYHASCAAVAVTLRQTGRDALIMVCQILSTAAGVATVICLFFFFTTFVPGTPTARLIIYGLFALNPALIAINTQATNDSFVICFGTLALFLLARYVRRPTVVRLSLLTVTAIAAACSKGNGLPLIPLAATVLAVQGAMAARRFPQGQRGRAARLLLALAPAAIFTALCLTIIPLSGCYASGQSPFSLATNITKRAPLPHFMTETTLSGVWPQRPGVTSVVHAYGTFRIVNLLENPLMTWWEQTYPRHRTSLWTQLFARSHLAQFDLWPPGWIMTTWYLVLLARANYLLALIPALFIAAGLCATLFALLRSLVARRPPPSPGPDAWITLLAAAVYLAFIVAYTMLYRDYSTMKPIFVFPALPAFAWLLAHAAGLFMSRAHRLLTAAALSSMALLSLLYAADIVILIRHLHGAAA